jgi:hypothetical protein
MSATMSAQSFNSTLGPSQSGASEAAGGDQTGSSRSSQINVSPPMLDMINKIDAKIKVRCFKIAGVSSWPIADHV